jgi:hypothetical protein
MGTMLSENPILGQDGQLTARLELKDAQEGFAGVSGMIWTIEPDGTFRAVRFLNAQITELSREGQLTKEGLASIAEALTGQDFFALPAKIGHESKANPHRMTLSFGQKAVTLVLPPGMDIAEAEAAHAGDQKSPEARFLTIARKVRTLVEDPGLTPR